jgi:hypothetical protein
MAIKPPFPQGAQVEHPKFGFGTVLSSNEERIVIKWDDHGEKKFVTPIVFPSLKKSDRQPPAEKRGTRSRRSKTPRTPRTPRASKASKAAKVAPAVAG